MGSLFKHRSTAVSVILLLLAFLAIAFFWLNSKKNKEYAEIDKLIEAAQNQQDLKNFEEIKQPPRERRLDNSTIKAKRGVDDFLFELNRIDETMSGAELRNARLQLLSELGSTLDLNELEKLAGSIRSKIYHTDISGILASRFAVEDPEAGMAWLIKESEWEDGSSASMAFASAAQLDRLPINELNSFASNKKKSLFLQGLTGSANFEVIKDAMLYLDAHPDVSNINGNLRGDFIRGKLEGGNFQEAYELSDIPTEQKTRNQLKRETFRAVALEDPTLAQKMLSSVQPQNERNVVIRSIANSWGTSEPEKVANWVNQLESVADRDSAKAGLAMAILHQDAVSSLEWVSSIENKDWRSELMRDMHKTLKITAPHLLPE